MIIEKFDRSMKIIKLPLNSMTPILKRVGIVRLIACGMNLDKPLNISTFYFATHAITIEADKKLKICRLYGTTACRLLAHKTRHDCVK